MNKLKAMGAEALKTLGEYTFKVGDVTVKPSKTGNVGYRAKLNDGGMVTFWDSTMDSVVESIDDETFKIKPGTQFAVENDGSFGLIDPKRVSGGFWSN